MQRSTISLIVEELIEECWVLEGPHWPASSSTRIAPT
jgi:hypothetical protein